MQERLENTASTEPGDSVLCLKFCSKRKINEGIWINSSDVVTAFRKMAEIDSNLANRTRNFRGMLGQYVACDKLEIETTLTNLSMLGEESSHWPKRVSERSSFRHIILRASCFAPKQFDHIRRQSK